jgi:hypothetical protein
LADLTINDEPLDPPPTSVKASKGATKPATAAPELYKAQVRVRWRNAQSGIYNDVAGGEVVTFDDGDFGGGRQLISLEDVLARGLFVPFDPAAKVTSATMSRDEMLEVLVAAGKGEGLRHDMPAEELRPLVAAHLGETSDLTEDGS